MGKIAIEFQNISKQYALGSIGTGTLTSLIETFKFGFLGVGTFSWFHLGYTLAFTVVIMLWGMVTFNRVQRSFMDVI